MRAGPTAELPILRFASVAGADPSLIHAHREGSEGLVAMCEGYWLPGDGGGGLFRWDPGATVPSDGGAVIAPAGSQRLAGRWIRQHGPRTDVRTFGVPSDGAEAPSGASNRERLQGAARYASETGATVWFPAGRYAIKGTLEVSAAEGLTLAGDGSSSRLVFDSMGAAILAKDVNRLVVQDIALAGTYARGIVAIAGHHERPEVTIRRCDIRGASRAEYPATSGVFLMKIERGGVYNCHFADIESPDVSLPSICIHIRQCQFLEISGNNCDSVKSNMGIGLDDTSNAFVRGNVVTGARVREDLGAWGYGIYFYRDILRPKGNVCADNIVRETEGTGIYVQGAASTLVRGNRIERACLRVAGVSLATGGIAVNTPADGCIVAENVVSTTGNEALACPGIRFDAPRSLVIGNKVRDTSGEGIQYNGSPSDSVISDNVVLGSGRGGISPYSFVTATHNLTIMRNTVTSTGAGGAGIACQAAHLGDARAVAIHSNTISRASGAGISAVNLEGFLVQANIVRDASIYASEYADIYLATCSNGVVSGNEATSSPASSPLYGIQVAGGRSIKLFNNDVRGSTLEVVHVIGATDVFVLDHP